MVLRTIHFLTKRLKSLFLCVNFLLFLSLSSGSLVSAEEIKVDSGVEPISSEATEEKLLLSETVTDTADETDFPDDEFFENEFLDEDLTLGSSSNGDPWEGFNRKVSSFNDVTDKYFLKPIANGYRAVTPQPVDNAVSNFFGNLGEIVVIVNDLLQLKFTQAASDTGRFVVNSTIGFFGFFDVASKIGLPKHSEDFGQTLGYWGVGPGPYLVLPFLGPSSVRDAFGSIPEYTIDELNLVSEIDDVATRNSLTALNIVDIRADLIPSEGLIQGDRYTFLRNFYQQRREYLVKDGNIEEDAFTDDDFEEEFFEDDLDTQF